MSDQALDDGVRRYAVAVVAMVVGLAVIKLICAASLPLTFDEALYWRWSKHLAGGYYDHPPINPLFIRTGTSLFGDNEFGVRVVGILMSLPATWAVWRAATILFDDVRTGITAALYLNLTLAMGVGAMIATSDLPVLVATSFLLFFLAKVLQTGRGEWWLAVGATVGLGMMSKYSMVFFAFGILLWLAAVPELRRWLLSPWSWAGAVISLAIFSPVVIWNFQHGWASVLYQSVRLVVHEWSLRYFGEYVLTQGVMLNPGIFVLGCMGLVGMWTLWRARTAAVVLISAMIWPMVLYFAWHSLHERVEGNWPSCMYPAFVIAAAVVAERLSWLGKARQTLVIWAKKSAVPVGLVLLACIYVQGAFAVIPLGRIDPTARVLGAGWRNLAKEIDEIRSGVGARVILTADYGMAGWLSFYLPSRTPVEQIYGRMRWINEPAPDAELFRGPMLFVCERSCEIATVVQKRFEVFQQAAVLQRSRRGVEIERILLFRVSGPYGPILDPP